MTSCVKPAPVFRWLQRRSPSGELAGKELQQRFDIEEWHWGKCVGSKHEWREVTMVDEKDIQENIATIAKDSD